MDFSKFEYQIQSWSNQSVQALSAWSYDYFVITLSMLICLTIVVGISPLFSSTQTTSREMIGIGIRKALVWSFSILASLLFVMSILVFLTKKALLESFVVSVEYYSLLLKTQWYWPVGLIPLTVVLKFSWSRWGSPVLSAMLYKRRKLQPTDSLSDISKEIQTYRQKDFNPSEYYNDTGLFIGLDDDSTPDYIPLSTWREINMQVIGPSRYGKGVLLGCLLDQITRIGDGLVYIDPKADHWAPHVLYQAAKKAGRQFYYLTLHDEGPGAWSPFAGGTHREALARLETAFGLDYTGNAGTDFYKSQEKAELEAAIHTTRSIAGLQQFLKGNDKTLRINAELKRWSEVKSLCPASCEAQFSIEQAIRENAVVYIQGSLDDPIVTTATKVLISEYVQTSRKLFKQHQRSHHLTMVVDEVSFLASQTLARALATSVGFNVNFVLAYQSPSDLLNVDDKTVDPRYLLQSITINSQVKVNYGGTDKDAAELVSSLSGTTTKVLMRSESTEIDPTTGGEVWEHGRSMMQQEVPLIHVNTMYALPPRVCAFFQPRSLAQIRYTSHVPVSDIQILPSYLIETFGSLERIFDSKVPRLSPSELELIQLALKAKEATTSKEAKTKTKSQGKSSGPRVFEGILMKYGHAPFEHNPENSVSFYVDIALDSNTIKTVWSIDLKSAIKESDVALNDEIRLEHLGKMPVEVEQKFTLDDGSSESRLVTIQRNSWGIEVINRAERETSSEVQTDQDVLLKRKSRRQRQKQNKVS